MDFKMEPMEVARRLMEAAEKGNRAASVRKHEAIPDASITLWFRWTWKPSRDYKERLDKY